MKKDRGFTNGIGKSTPPSPQGFTNGMGNNSGMINGNGHTNGTYNNSSMVNNDGHTNGMTNGLVNGNYSNNIDNIKINFREKKGASKIKIIMVVLILIISSIFAMSLLNKDINEIRPLIDGEYNEWNNMIDIGFGKLGIIQENNKVLIGLEKDNILKGDKNITESYLFFINDHNSEEGFYLGYDTYEYYIDIFGRNNKIVDAKGFQFDESKKNNDWSGFKSKYNTYSLSSVNNQSIIEFEIHSLMLGHQNFENMSLLIFHYDTEGGYEYSQILDINKNSTSTKVSNTRTPVSINYRHIFEKNELHIDTSSSLAYISIPYEIRIVQEITIATESKIEPSIIENKTIEPNIDISEPQFKEMGTKIIINYNYYEPDIIEQCGGNIINTTVDINLTDKGFIIYDFNKTVKSMKITGDINTTIIKDITRSGTIDLLNSQPSPEPSGSITSMKANEYDNTEQEITVDGILDEYFWSRIPVDQYYIDVIYDMKIWTLRNSTHVFVGVHSISDASDGTGDKTSIYFDTDNDETSTPDVDDKRIEIDGTDTITYYEGDGSVWQSTTLPSDWDAGESLTDADRTFEFVIPISDLNENEQFNSVDTTIGFGVYNIDDATPPPSALYHLWYPDAYYSGETPTTQYMNKPDTWSDLEYGDDFTGTEFADYDMYSPITIDTITIDGDLDESAWTTTAHDWTIDCNGHEAYLYIMKDTTYLYIGWYSRNYDTLNANDFCQIYFDTDYDGTVDPDTADKLLQIGDDNVTTYFEGTGAGWSSTTIPTNWAGKNGATTGNITWEARFTLSELDENNNFGETNEKIGFGITVGHVSASPIYTLSWPNACEHDFEMSGYKYHPESWGNLVYAEIPEFTEIAPMILFLFFIGSVFIIKRRDKDEKNE